MSELGRALADRAARRLLLMIWVAVVATVALVALLGLLRVASADGMAGPNVVVGIGDSLTGCEATLDDTFSLPGACPVLSSEQKCWNGWMECYLGQDGRAGNRIINLGMGGATSANAYLVFKNALRDDPWLARCASTSKCTLVLAVYGNDLSACDFTCGGSTRNPGDRCSPGIIGNDISELCGRAYPWTPAADVTCTGPSGQNPPIGSDVTPCIPDDTVFNVKKTIDLAFASGFKQVVFWGPYPAHANLSATSETAGRLGGGIIDATQWWNPQRQGNLWNLLHGKKPGEYGNDARVFVTDRTYRRACSGEWPTQQCDPLELAGQHNYFNAQDIPGFQRTGSPLPFVHLSRKGQMMVANEICRANPGRFGICNTTPDAPVVAFSSATPASITVSVTGFSDPDTGGWIPPSGYVTTQTLTAYAFASCAPDQLASSDSTCHGTDPADEEWSNLGWLTRNHSGGAVPLLFNSQFATVVGGSATIPNLQPNTRYEICAHVYDEFNYSPASCIAATTLP